MIAQIKDGGAVDVLAENVEVRLWDSQWVNVVNHADCYRDMDKEEAIATAVRMTERLMAENITKGFPPSAYNRAAVAELINAADCFTCAIAEDSNYRDDLLSAIRELERASFVEQLNRVRSAIANLGGAK